MSTERTVSVPKIEPAAAERPVAACVGAVCKHVVVYAQAERQPDITNQGYSVHITEVPFCGVTEVYVPGTGVVPRTAVPIL